MRRRIEFLWGKVHRTQPSIEESKDKKPKLYDYVMFVNMYKIFTCVDCLHLTSQHTGRVSQTLNNIDIDQKRYNGNSMCSIWSLKIDCYWEKSGSIDGILYKKCKIK